MRSVYQDRAIKLMDMISDDKMTASAANSIVSLIQACALLAIADQLEQLNNGKDNK